MAQDPAFAATPVVGAAILGSAETSLTVPVNSSVILTAGANGLLLSEVAVIGVTTSLAPAVVAGLVYLFWYDGTTYHHFDDITISAALTGSSTVAPFRTNKLYNDSPRAVPTGWFLRASHSIAGNANLLKVTGFGSNF